MVNLLSQLDAAGVQVTVNAAGDGLSLRGQGRPPADLLEAVHACKAALLTVLTSAKKAAAPPLPVLADSQKQRGEIMPGPVKTSEVEAAAPRKNQPRCAICARWEALPAPLAHMGLCNAGRLAHGWADGNPHGPVEISGAHGCVVCGGRGHRRHINETQPMPVPIARLAP